MYNTDFPNRAELPTSAQLKRSTIIAALAALVILVTVVMPSEYAIDPTGAGRLLGLTKMGEIKTQLAAEAADAAAGSNTTAAGPPQPDAAEGLLVRMQRIENLLVSLIEQMPVVPEKAEQPVAGDALAVGDITPVEASPVEASAETVEVPQEKAAQPEGRRDEMIFTLAPGEGAEIKLEMHEGAEASFAWIVVGGVVNFDAHGDGGGQSVSYEKGRSVSSSEGVLKAAFAGNHGWLWRNRGDKEVSVTLQTRGDYLDIKRLL